MVPTRVRSVPRRAFTPELLARLHALANRLLSEDAEHFRVHAETNDVVHVFERADTGEVVGFQFWRTAPMALPRARALLGGKLRVDPAFRNRALHLRSGLRYFVACKARHPHVRFYRLSLASMFGFVSITSALADYHLFDPAATDEEGRAVREILEQLAAESDFHLDPATGLFAVGIHMNEETLARYPAAYFAKPQALAYARANPAWRDNGCYVAFWFRFTWQNLWALTRAIARKW
ncbi:MAG: hypothetical protein R3B48_23325 [Kofleriaceae bacterium]